tara:strand:+ start:12878 stop:13111 length:234 start_codon:yes stop_codon:yes gene_type:complete
MTCTHDRVTFRGSYSLIGNYRCDDCKEIIDPIEYAKMKGDLNFELLDYYTEHPDRLNPMWQDHPWVAHLYKEQDETE